ncbi:MAG: prohibitin family protein [Firmicutes bacterium]|nr:prohibitin family protein [Bacillota bacterium]
MDENNMNVNVKKHRKGVGKALPLIIVLVLVAITVFSSMTTVAEGTVGVKYRFGKITATNLHAGLHFNLPYIEYIERVDITEQVYDLNTTAYTRDTQTVDNIMIKVNYVYDTSKLDEIIRTIGIRNVESKLVAPQLLSCMKNEVGKYKAEELISARSLVQENIEAALREQLSQNGIIITAINIEDIDFEDEFEATIRAKVAAEQEALRVKNETVKKEEEAKQIVIAAEAEAQSIKIKAEAEAEANKILSESITDNLIKYNQIEKWSGEFPQVMGNTVNPFVTIGE